MGSGEKKREQEGNESLLEKIIWLFIYLGKGTLKKALIRVAEVSSKINWHSLKGH